MPQPAPEPEPEPEPEGARKRWREPGGVALDFLSLAPKQLPGGATHNPRYPRTKDTELAILSTRLLG